MRLSPPVPSPKLRSIAAILCGFALASACGGAPQSAPAGDAAASQEPASTVQQVSGRAPAASGGFPSIIVLEPIGAADLAPQAQAPRMDQEQQTFIPSLLVVRTGQPVDFLNHDDVLHNVRVKNGDTRESAFNVAIPTGEKYTHTFKDDGFYDVGCDIHPGMSAQIFSSTSPWVVLADDTGAFTIAGVPKGPYKAVAYAGAQKIEKEISVSAGSGPLDLTKP